MLDVESSPPLPLPDTEKLLALQRLDQFREWRSLDDERFCLVCGKIINGHQVHVSAGALGNGPLRLSCPSERCTSIPMDWALPTDEILAVAKTISSGNGATISPKVAETPAEGGWMSQLRKLLRIPTKFSNGVAL